MITNILFKYETIWEDVTEELVEYVTSLTRSCQMASDSFKLGDTYCMAMNMRYSKDSGLGIPKQVKMVGDMATDNLITFVDSYTIIDDDTISLDLLDGMANFNYYYDATVNNDMDAGVPLLTLVEDMCDQAGVELETRDFFDADKIINWYDSTITARQYIGYIAEINGGYAKINGNGKLEFAKYTNDGQMQINVDECSDIYIGERHEITRVYYDPAGIEIGEDTGNTLYVDSTNPYIEVYDNESQEVNNIYNSINGYVFYNVRTSNCPTLDVTAGDGINYIFGEDVYPTFAQISQVYSSEWGGGYALDLLSERQEETIIESVSQTIKSLKTTINRVSGEMEIVAEETGTIGTAFVVNTQGVDIFGTEVNEEGEVGRTQAHTHIDSEGVAIHDQENNVGLRLSNGVAKVKTFQTGPWRIESANNGNTLNFYWKGE